jgi:hypothetical protein
LILRNIFSEQLIDFLEAKPGFSGAAHANDNIGFSFYFGKNLCPGNRRRQISFLEIINEL